MEDRSDVAPFKFFKNMMSIDVGREEDIIHMAIDLAAVGNEWPPKPCPPLQGEREADDKRAITGDDALLYCQRLRVAPREK
jgi:hypothetical protein